VRTRQLRQWWPLAALTLLAAALRLSTLDLQSFWYDEAFTPVHVLHASLGATLRAVAHTENTPPLWYVASWGVARVFGAGEVALRSLSALAGVATVPVAWGIGCELVGGAAGGRRAAIATAALVAVNPLLIWYSQEARAYGLFVLLAALAMLCFLRALRAPTRAKLAAFALTGALALLSHYFAVFLLAPMCIWLLAAHGGGPVRSPADGGESPPSGARAGGSARTDQLGLAGSPASPALPWLAVAAIVAVGAALLPLIVAQGGHGTQWIGRWALSSRLAAIPQYYLTGYMGGPLGHSIELLVALPILAGVGYGLWRVLEPPEERGALIALTIAACGMGIPIALALAGADYLAPRNLVAAMIPLSVLLAILITAARTGWIGMALAGLVALAFLAIAIDTELSPRLQRGDWRGLARVLRSAGWETGAQGSAGVTPARPGADGVTPIGRGAGGVITTVELGAVPLEYYLPPLHNLPRGARVTVSEIDETGYAPLRAGAERPPAPGFRLVASSDIHGLILYRFRSQVPRTVSEATLRRHVITLAHPEVLVPGGT
jgi:mannosyltransferase